MNTLPVTLHNPQILLIGGGSVALRKAQVLTANAIAFNVVAREVMPQFEQLRCRIYRRSFASADLDGIGIVVDASGSAEVAALLRREKQRRFLLVNNAASAAECDFYFSSLLCCGKLKVAVSSAGSSPVITQAVRDAVAVLLPDELADISDTALQRRLQGVINGNIERKRVLLALRRHVEEQLRLLDAREA